VRSYGGRVDGVELRRGSNGVRGLFATVDIPSGASFVVVPRRLLLDAGSTREAKGFATANDDATTSPPPAGWAASRYEVSRRLLAALRNEMSKSDDSSSANSSSANSSSSFYQPYINSIRGEPCLETISLTANEIQGLQGTLSHAPFRHVWQRYQSMAERLCGAGGGGQSAGGADIEACRWAVGAVGSRPLLLEDRLRWMPVVDLINRADHNPHNAEVVGKRLGDDVTQAMVVSNRVIPAGEEVTISYGSLGLGKGAALWGVVLQGVDPLPLPVLQLVEKRPGFMDITTSSSLGEWVQGMDVSRLALRAAGCAEDQPAAKLGHALEALLACQRAELMSPGLFQSLLEQGLIIAHMSIYGNNH